jgi:hypothetical protein
VMVFTSIGTKRLIEYKLHIVTYSEGILLIASRQRSVQYLQFKYLD